MFNVTYKDNINEEGILNGFTYTISKWCNCELQDGSYADVYICCLQLRGQQQCCFEEGEDIWHKDFLSEIEARNWLLQMTR